MQGHVLEQSDIKLKESFTLPTPGRKWYRDRGRRGRKAGRASRRGLNLQSVLVAKSREKEQNRFLLKRERKPHLSMTVDEIQIACRKTSTNSLPGSRVPPPHKKTT